MVAIKESANKEIIIELLAIVIIFKVSSTGSKLDALQLNFKLLSPFLLFI